MAVHHRNLARISLAAMALWIVSARAEVTVYPTPPGLPTSSQFTMTADGKAVWVEWAGWETFSNLNIANFSCTGPVTIVLTASENINRYLIRPKSFGLTGQVSGRTLIFTLSGPTKVYVEVNSLTPLLVFADVPESNIPSQSDPSVTWYGPGKINDPNAPADITLQSNHTYYFAPGTVYHGRIRGNSVQNVRITGRGILHNGYNQSPNTVVQIRNSSNVTIEGIQMRNFHGWACWITNCTYSTLRNIKMYGYGDIMGNDGIDLVSCRNFLVDSCFVRSNDDCIAIKSSDFASSYSGYSINTDSLTVTNCLMSGVSGSDGITLGYELNSPLVQNVLVKNCNIVSASGGSHSGFSIVCDGPAWVQNIRYEDIHVEENLGSSDNIAHNFMLRVTDGTAWGRDPPGHIKNIYLKNCTWLNTVQDFAIWGYGGGNLVEDVTFENCTVAGKLLRSTADAAFSINGDARNIRFVVGQTVVRPAAAVTPARHAASHTAVIFDITGKALRAGIGEHSGVRGRGIYIAQSHGEKPVICNPMSVSHR